MPHTVFDRRVTLQMMCAGAVSLITGGASARTSLASVNKVPWAALQDAVQGKVIPREVAGFETTRRSLMWNRWLPRGRSPDVIVQATSERDVAAAVRFGKQNRLKVALRSSGHSYHCASLRNGGVLLDVGSLKSIDVDARARRASVGAGVKAGELMARLAPLGLAFPVGHCSDVGLGGYLLGGGIGWHFGEWGPACLSVTGMQMVTAAGDLIYADESRNTDLFWAARGGGRGFFAAVTRYDLALHDLPKAIRALSVTFEMDAALEVADWLDRAITFVHPATEVIYTLVAPADSSSPPALVVLAFAMADSPAAASARWGTLNQPPPALRGKIEERAATFEELLRMTDAGFPSGKRMSGDQRYSNASLRELLSATAQLMRAGRPGSFMTYILLGGRSLAPCPADAACALSGQVSVGAYAFWDDPADDEVNRAWVRSTMRATEPHSIGAYISEVDVAARPGLARQCFSPDAWSRLSALKRKHDPSDLFAE